MEYLHAKSPCCRGRIIKFGKRRRQCILCRSTWRIRQKKRGRKRKRAIKTLFRKYLNHEIPTIYVLARIRKGKSEDQRQRDLRRSLKKFIDSTPWPPFPYGEPVISVADAMMITINKKIYTFYFILVKRVLDTKATIAAPYIAEGKESYEGWQKAFAALPKAVLASICALVCDGHLGLIYMARRKSWIIQRCNFHAIAKIQSRRSRWARSRHRKMGEFLYQLMNDALTKPSEEVALDSVRKLWEISRRTNSKNLKTYLSGFTRYYWEYRTYLQYPQLHLPRTSNSVESIIGSIRKLCNRAHGFRTINSLTLWVHALLKNKKIATCNGNLPTKLMR